MAQQKQQPIRLVAANVVQPGHLHLLEYDRQERLQRALKALLICWALALAAVPVVFAHWVLVPGFIIASPFVAYRYYNKASVAREISGCCPQCQQEITLPVEAADKLPMWRYCPQCNQSLQLMPGPD